MNFKPANSSSMPELPLPDIMPTRNRNLTGSANRSRIVLIASETVLCPSAVPDSQHALVNNYMNTTALYKRKQITRDVFK